LYIALFVLVLLFMVISLTHLFLNRKWILIYTAFGNEAYFAIVRHIKSAGIQYKTKAPLHFRSHDRFKDYTQFVNYVKKKDESAANAALYTNAQVLIIKNDALCPSFSIIF
jgi:glucan phosphoethanolaminetransferase (alkaline phosphatase superfamily)